MTEYDIEKSKTNKNLKFRILRQYVKDLSFENYAGQECDFETKNKNLKIDLKIKHKKIETQTHEITLILYLEALLIKKKIFVLDLSYSGLFEFNLSDRGDHLKRTLFVDCPGMIYPFMRKIIFDLTVESGFSPVTLDYVDFRNLYESHSNES